MTLTELKTKSDMFYNNEDRLESNDEGQRAKSRKDHSGKAVTQPKEGRRQSIPSLRHCQKPGERGCQSPRQSCAQVCSSGGEGESY